MKNYYKCLLLTLFLLLINKLVINQINYQKKSHSDKNSISIHKLEQYSKILTNLSIGITLVGFFYYLFLKKKRIWKKF